jgi:hypothetical protein
MWFLIPIVVLLLLAVFSRNGYLAVMLFFIAPLMGLLLGGAVWAAAALFVGELITITAFVSFVIFAMVLFQGYVIKEHLERV